MGKIRQSAIRCEDPEKTAPWLQDYEAELKSPEGLVVDVGHWAGTSPIPQPEAALASSAGE